MDRTSLIYRNVWPFRFIPEIQDKPKSLITSEWIFKPYSRNGSIDFNRITLFTICHKDLMSVDSGLRTDFMVSEIDKTLKGSELIRSGDFQFLGGEDFVADAGGKWYGTLLRYGTLKV